MRQRHRWQFWALGSIRHLTKAEKCAHCVAKRKVRGRHWRYWQRGVKALGVDDAWVPIVPLCCGPEQPKDDRQRELFNGEVAQ